MAGEAFTHVEPFDQGLVTSRDAALLQPGELAQADNTVYRPNDPSIQKAKGRTVYNTSAIGGAPTIQGLRFLNFDTASPLLIAHATNQYYYSTMTGETGSFNGLAAAGGTGTTLEAVQYNDKHYLFNGNGTQNTVVLSDATTRGHGLQPVIDPATASLVTGSWNLSLGVGYYHFITVELVNPDSSDEIESTNYTRDDVVPSVQFTSSNISSQSVSITKPGTINSTATHWRIYMAGPTTDAKPVPPRSDFYAVGGPINISTTTITIGNTVASGTNGRVPTANTPIAAGGWTNPANAQGVTGGGDFAGAANNVGATATTTGTATLWKTFQFSGLSGTVTGVQVDCKVHGGGTVGAFSIKVKLTWNNAANFTSEYTQKFEPTGSTTYDKMFNFVQWRVMQFGSPNDPWGRTWNTATDFLDANFGVQVTLNNAGSATAYLDYVKVTVHSVGTSGSTQIFKGKQFPVVVVSSAGITTTIGSHGQPPIATTGDIFEDQLVTNDVADASRIVYSLPTQPDYVPNLYFINFETKQTDEVTLVKRLGDKLMVGQKTQLFRVNYLPRETDSEFDRGRCYETVSEGQGVVGVQAAATFTVPGGPILMAFVSYSGIHVTDGFQVDTLTDDLDWPSLVDLPTAADPTDVLKNCILVDYPLNYWLKLYYPVPGGTTNTKAITIHYHPSHRKPNGKMKVTGPETVAAGSATCGRVADAPVLLTGSTDGKVYVEDRGYTQNQGGTLAVTIKTREMYPWGMDNTGTVEWMGIRHNQDATSTVTVTALLREGDAAQTTFAVTDTLSTAFAGLSDHPLHFFTDSMQLQLTEPGADGGSGMRLSAVLATCISRGGRE